MAVQEIAKKIESVLREHDVAFAGLFGSHARGEERSDSDVDILVRFKEPIGLFEFVGLQRQLSERIGRKVDLVTEGSLSPYIRDSVLRDLQPIYEK